MIIGRRFSAGILSEQRTARPVGTDEFALIPIHFSQASLRDAIDDCVLSQALKRLPIFLCPYWSKSHNANGRHPFRTSLTPGERIEGYSNFLWVLLLAALNHIGVPIEWAGQALGIWFAALCVALVGIPACRNGAQARAGAGSNSAPCFAAANSREGLDMPTISVVMIVKNEESAIEACLRSVDWADEIIVADDRSTDRTVELCRRFPRVQVFSHDRVGEGPKRNFALTKATGEWILTLDADERISPEFKQEFLRRVGHEPVNGYRVRMTYLAFGRWVTDYKAQNTRIFKRTHGSYLNVHVHAYGVIEGPVGELQVPVVHCSTTYASLEGDLAKQNTYTTHAARDLYEKGRRLSAGNMVSYLLLRPLYLMVRKYVLWGYRYGCSGLLLAVLTGYDYFLSYAKLWEYQRARTEKPGERAAGSSLMSGG